MTTTDAVSIYCRQSFDRHEDSLAVTRQLDACRTYATDRGWTVAHEYIDNDRSATSGKVRPEFERLLADRPAAIVVWHTDRLVRLTRDLERVIDLGVNVHAVKAGHLDLSHPAGRATARTVTAWATYETEQKAIRQRAANDQRAEAGLPYKGQRAFGFERDGMTIREAEAAELRAAADAVLRGSSLNSICRDLNARGVLTATGKTWRVISLKAALLSPRNAGLRRHRGEVVGSAAWPAILDETTVAGVRAVLLDPSRARKGPTRRYLLSGLMACGVCGETVTGALVKGKGPQYRCLGDNGRGSPRRFHVTRNAERIDTLVTALVVERLSRPDAVDLFARPAEDGPDLDAWREELRSIRARLDGLAEAYGAGDIDLRALTAGTRRLRGRQEQIEGDIAGAVTNPVVAEVLSADDVGGAFSRLGVEVRRAVIAELLNLALMPIGAGKRVSSESFTEHVRIEWKGWQS